MDRCRVAGDLKVGHPTDGIHVAALNVKRLSRDTVNPESFRRRMDDWEGRVLSAGGVGWRTFMDPSLLGGYLSQTREI